MSRRMELVGISLETAKQVLNYHGPIFSLHKERPTFPMYPSDLMKLVSKLSRRIEG